MFAIDTNIVAFALNGRKLGVWERVRTGISRGTPLFLSSIVLMGLEYGYARSNRRTETERITRSLLAVGFTVSDFTAEDAAQAGRIRADPARRAEPIGSYDVLSAAHALRLDATLATDNVREFAQVSGLRIENWVD